LLQAKLHISLFFSCWFFPELILKAPGWWFN